MKNILLKGIFCLCLLGVSLPVLAYTDKEIADYFQYLKAIQQLPAGTLPISPCNTYETKAAIAQLKHDKLNKLGRLSFNEEGKVTDEYGENIVVYKGDFSNEKMVEFLFLITGGGSLSTDTVAGVYKRVKNRLIDLNFDNVVIKNLIPGGDMSGFYMWTAKPFLYVRNHRTYMRFMSYPGEHTDYDKSKLLVCTYQWQGKRFKLVGVDKKCVGG